MRVCTGRAKPSEHDLRCQAAHRARLLGPGGPGRRQAVAVHGGARGGRRARHPGDVQGREEDLPSGRDLGDGALQDEGMWRVVVCGVGVSSGSVVC